MLKIPISFMDDLSRESLRKRFKGLRNKLSLQEQTKLSEHIAARIQTMPVYQRAKRIAFYHPFQREVSLNSLWLAATEADKLCYFPVMEANQSLTFWPALPSSSFIKNPYGILEPEKQIGPPLPLSKLDLLCVPLLIFDGQCNRIGMGGGYYDRTLAKGPWPFLLGVAYELQHYEKLNPASWDVPMNAIVSEKTIYWREEDFGIKS